MPHVAVTMTAGRTEAQKQRLAEAITRAVMAEAGCSEDAVSVAIEEVAGEAWMRDVYERSIGPWLDRLYKKPGYGPG